jgi:hypothetical protein
MSSSNVELLYVIVLFFQPLFHCCFHIILASQILLHLFIAMKQNLKDIKFQTHDKSQIAMK